MFRAEKIQEFSLLLPTVEKMGLVPKTAFDVSDQVQRIESEFGKKESNNTLM